MSTNRKRPGSSRAHGGAVNAGVSPFRPSTDGAINPGGSGAGPATLFDFRKKICDQFGHGKPAGVLCCECGNQYALAVRGTGLDVTGRRIEVNCKRKPRDDEERRTRNR